MPHRHHLQERPDSCVAASVVILHNNAGQNISEALVRAQLGAPPLDLSRAASFGNYRCMDFTKETSLELLLSILSADWCAVTVGGGPAAARAGAQGWTTPHGPLATALPGYSLTDTALPHHVIVLTKLADAGDTLHYLDPYFNAASQPGQVELVEFVQRWWMGSVLAL